MFFEEYNFDDIIYILVYKLNNCIFDMILFFFYRYVKCDFTPIHAV